MASMDLNFRNLTLEDKKTFDKYLKYIHEPYGSEYCFTNTFIEDVYGDTQICETDGMFFVKTKWSGRRVFFPPMLKDPAKLQEAIHLIEQEVSREKVPLEILMVGEIQANMLDPNKYKVTDDRALAEYIYLSENLIHLTGKKFHSKRNFITRFCKTHPNYTFRGYDEKLDRNNILQLLKKWDVNTTHEKWVEEDKLINRALDTHKNLGLKIAVLYVGDNLVAFSVNYVRTAEIAYTLFEKADTNYIGVYQVINQRTAKMFFGGTKYINRQCDMNVEGLRKAKLSYNPVMLLPKYKVQHRN